MFFFLFHPQESFCRDAGHSGHSSFLFVEMKCPLYVIKELATLDNFANESVLEKCMKTVHVLVV